MTKHILYWEDVGERVLYAQLDDYAWKLPEKYFHYKKQSSFYIYHDQKLAAYYHPNDIKKEASIGYSFYTNSKNVERVIKMKKVVADKVRTYEMSIKNVSTKELGDKDLLKYLTNTLDLYHEALSVHYLTQPQFFEEFEKSDDVHNRYKENLERLAHARLKYTRASWTKAMQLCKPYFNEYAKRRRITTEEAESMTYEELKHNGVDKKVLAQRANKYVLVSKFHNLKIYVGSKVDEYVNTYEQYQGIESVKGIIGNKGIARGKAFVVSNKNLDLKNLPKGMGKGMILIVQNAWPEFGPYYQRASAIVTNEGGITSHGVIIAREFRIPCIIGTKIATKVLKDGDLVEVDANKGIVRKIK